MTAEDKKDLAAFLRQEAGLNFVGTPPVETLLRWAHALDNGHPYTKLREMREQLCPRCELPALRNCGGVCPIVAKEAA